MAQNIDPNLVRDIAAKVLAAMEPRGEAKGTGSNAKAPASSPSAPVAVRPPVGTCTGDYSKFKEKAEKGSDPFVAAALNDKSGAMREEEKTQQVEEPALSGILTATQLQAAIAASSAGVATLAADARFSPLAADFAREHPEKIRRIAANASTGKNAGPSTTTDAQWLWWIDGYCPSVQQLVTQQRNQLRAATASHNPSVIASVIRELAREVSAKRLAGGILFVRCAARAVCYANRNPALRAVVGTCGEAVELGISELGANVLVIEYPHHGLKSMGAMVGRITQQPPTVPATVQRELSDLQR